MTPQTAALPQPQSHHQGSAHRWVPCLCFSWFSLFVISAVGR